MDFYLSEANVTNRLVKEWEQHKNLIIAYDFDNTVYDYHKEGHEYNQVIELLRECKIFGAHLIVFTAKSDDEFPEMINYLKENNIPFDAINESPEYLPFKGKKIYYNILLDDRAGLPSAYNSLKNALEILKRKSQPSDERKSVRVRHVCSNGHEFFPEMEFTDGKLVYSIWNNNLCTVNNCDSVGWTEDNKIL